MEPNESPKPAPPTENERLRERVKELGEINLQLLHACRDCELILVAITSKSPNFLQKAISRAEGKP